MKSEDPLPLSHQTQFRGTVYHFRKKLAFWGGELLAPRSNTKFENHPLSAFCYVLFSIFAVTLHISIPSPKRIIIMQAETTYW
jgi:hypothetical protein